MKKPALLLHVLCAIALVAAPSVASAATIAPSSILSNPQSYNGQSVTVRGTVQDFTARQTRRGTVSIYKVCDKQCVDVLDPSGGTQTDGNNATVTGTFHATLKTRKKTFTNVLVIGL